MTERELEILKPVLPFKIWCELHNEVKKQSLLNRMQEQQNRNLVTIDRKQIEKEFEKAISQALKNIKF